MARKRSLPNFAISTSFVGLDVGSELSIRSYNKQKVQIGRGVVARADPQKSSPAYDGPGCFE